MDYRVIVEAPPVAHRWLVEVYWQDIGQMPYMLRLSNKKSAWNAIFDW